LDAGTLESGSRDRPGVEDSLEPQHATHLVDAPDEGANVAIETSRSVPALLIGYGTGLGVGAGLPVAEGVTVGVVVVVAVAVGVRVGVRVAVGVSLFVGVGVGVSVIVGVGVSVEVSTVMVPCILES